MKRSGIKICFFQPWNSITNLIPHFGLGYLAASVRKEGFTPLFLPPTYAILSAERVVKEIAALEPDVVAISIMSTFFNKACRIIKLLKSTMPKIKVVIGGPHVSALSEYSLKTTGADFAVMGEGEVTLCHLLRILDGGSSRFDSIDGLAFRSGDSIITNNGRELIEDINTLPFPAWDLMMLTKYPPTPHGAFYKRFPTAPVMTTRGCAFDCDFCASNNTWKRRLRHRDPGLVVDEIEYLMKDFGIRDIYFEDDNIVSPVSHIMRICDEILRRNLDIVWSCPAGVRVDMLTMDLLKAMKKAGNDVTVIIGARTAKLVI